MKRFQDTEYFINEAGEIERGGKKLKPSIRNGYFGVNLYINKKRISKSIHRIVAETFIPNPDNKPQVNHINGIKTDNRIQNLEWVTPSENITHSFRNGLQKPSKGENHGRCKLNKEDIKYIRQNYIPYHKQFGTKGLSKKYNVCPQQIHRIIKRERWF
jgi:hypothetical protein